MRDFEPIPFTPGPEAPLDDLRVHAIHLNTLLACRSYEDVTLSCRWCTRSDVELPVRQKMSGYDLRFCEERCRAAWQVWRAAREKPERIEV